MREHAWVALALVLAIIAFAFLLRVVAITVTTPDGNSIEGTLFDFSGGSNVAITGDDSTNTVTISQDFVGKARLDDQVSENHWVIPGWYCRANTATTPTADQVRFIPIAVSQDETYDSIGVNVSSAGMAGEVARLGIYQGEIDSTGLQITDLVLDAGTVSVATTGNKTISINQALTQGYYWLAFVTDSGTAQFSSCLTSQAVGSFMAGYTESLGTAPGKLLLRTNGAGVGALANPAAPDGAIHLNPGGVGIPRLLE